VSSRRSLLIGLWGPLGECSSAYLLNPEIFCYIIQQRLGENENIGSEMKTISHALNLFCLEFAAWTVCVNIAVRLQGNLKALLLVAFPVLTAVAWFFVRHRRQFNGLAAPPEQMPGSGRKLVPFNGAAALLGIIVYFVSVFFLRKGNIFLPWAVTVAYFAFPTWSALKTEGFPESKAPASSSSTGPPHHGARDRGPMVIWLVGLLAVALTLTAHRPDIDDAYYVNMAVTAAESPSLPLLRHSSLYDLPDIPISFHPYQFHSIEILAGSLSYLTGLPAIIFFHFFLAGVGALLCILAYALLFDLLESRFAALAVVIVLVVLLFLGVTHRAYGNFALVRLFQGKAVYATAIVPLIAFYALRYSLRPCWSNWGLLLAAQVCGLGMTSSSLYVTPLLVVVVLLAGRPPINRKSFIVFSAGLASLCYLAAVLLYMLVRLPISDNTSRALERPDPWAFLGGNISTVFGRGRPLLFSLFVFLLAWFFFRPGLGRRLALAASGVFLLTVLNPFLVPLFSRVEPFEFWRFFWAFPLPFLIAGIILSPFRLIARLPGWAVAAASGSLLALFLLIGGSFVLRPTNGVKMGPPSLKVDAYYHVALELARSVPRSSLVLAPDPVNIWLATIQPHVYPLRVRGYEFQEIKVRYGFPEVWWREFMVSYVDGISHSPNDRDLFRQGLKRFRLSAVCLPRGLAWRPEAAGLLRENGFVYSRTVRRHDIWMKSTLLQPALPHDR
jgi:hypothetical protein